MENIEVIFVEVHAKNGSSLAGAIKDAMKIAVDEWRNVKLRHNGNTYEILINDLFSVACGDTQKSTVSN